MGLTRREQQLIPLIAEGLTNKEIANRFCLSEQTVKNHLYRMKHKVGAGDRLGIVQVCRITRIYGVRGAAGARRLRGSWKAEDAKLPGAGIG
jgi:DNA-binding CsgD family transcriptional regulator